MSVLSLKISAKINTLLNFHKPSTLHNLKQIHSTFIVSGFSNLTFLLTKFLSFLTLSPETDFAYVSDLLTRIKEPDINICNGIIRCLSKSIQPQLALVFYSRIRQDGVFPNKHTFPLLLKSFSTLRNENPDQFYAHILKFGWDTDSFVRNALISAFANRGYIAFARKVFDECLYKDVVTWTAIIDGYLKNECSDRGLHCFVEMVSTGVRVDEVTVSSVLSAIGMVGDLWLGKCIHGLYVEQGRVKWDAYVGSALVDMYSKCGYCDDAFIVFDIMPIKNVVSWSTMIAGYVQCSRPKDALAIFQNMLKKAVKPNHSTLTSVITACAQLGTVVQGRWVHEYIIRNNLEINSPLGTALIDMYAKCGCLDEALLVFVTFPTNDVYPWTAIINGLALHGHGLTALNLFSNMVKNGIRPNEITFIGVLSACSHGGLVSEGRELFGLMKTYGLKPNMDHYSCMVDILGRAGYLEEARKFIDEMPIKPSPGIWRVLFGACMIHKAYELGEYVGKHLINLQPDHGSGYVLLANLYSANRRWDGAAQVRKLMISRGIGKMPGLSWIEMNGVIHEFIAFDNSHAESEDIYEVLDHFIGQLKLIGWVPDGDLLTFDGHGA